MSKLAFSLIVAAAVAAPAVHAEVPAGRSAEVSFADLDLSSQRDADTLRRRIGSAVEKVCATPRTSLLPSNAEMKCRNSAHASAMPAAEQAIAMAAGRKQQLASAASLKVVAR